MLDEAYYDYASYFAAQRGMEYSHSLDYVRQNRPVVVLRTFSKAHGLAGLRVGYGFGPAELLSYFNRLKPPFMVSSIGEAAALAALADAEHIQKSVRSNAVGAELLTREIAAMGIRVISTWANFLFCEVGPECAAVCQHLQDEGVIVRPLVGSWRAPNAFRVTIGTPEQNAKFLAALEARPGPRARMTCCHSVPPAPLVRLRDTSVPSRSAKSFPAWAGAPRHTGPHRCPARRG